jgi:uncharacterized protein (TIGR00369 family)
MSNTTPSRLPVPQGPGADLDDLDERPGGNALGNFIGLRHTGPGVAKLTIRPDLVNGGGMLIGPVGFALVDYTMGSLLWSQCDENEWIATINIAVNYIQSAAEGEVECRTALDRRNRHIAVMRSQVHHEDGRLLITAVGSFSIYTPHHMRAGATPDRPMPPA